MKSMKKSRGIITLILVLGILAGLCYYSATIISSTGVGEDRSINLGLDLAGGVSITYQVVGEFKCCNVYAKEKCRDCFARFYCSGGCAANAYNFHGDILKTYETGCELQKKRVECAIMIKAAMAEQED